MRYRSPNKITRSISIDRKIYSHLIHLKQISHSKSVAKVINLLLNDEIKHRHINFSNRNEYLMKMSKLIEKVGRLDREITGACNNLNQIAYHLNLSKSNQSNPPIHKIIKDIHIIQKIKVNVRNIERSESKRWRQLI